MDQRALYTAFLNDEIGAEALPAPKWGPIGEEVYRRTYARPVYETDPMTGEVVRDALGVPRPQKWWRWSLPADGRTTEVWGETVRRVALGNIGFVDGRHLLEDEAVDLFQHIYEHKMTPAGRHLWVTGTGIAYSRNCWASGWSERTSDHFRFLAMRLFEGGGVGANYSLDLRKVISPSVSTVHVSILCDAEHADFGQVYSEAGGLWYAERRPVDADTVYHKVEDTREGWVDAYCDLIDASTHDEPVHIVFDVSDVRPFGSPLATFGGRASGPGPLVRALVDIAHILRSAHGDILSGIDCLAIDHAIAASVVAGGARRSARMSMMHWRDPEIFDFIECKADPTQNWTTNISVEIDGWFASSVRAGDEHAMKILEAVCSGMRLNGEPGFIDTDYLSVGESERIRVTNPCGEIGLAANYSAMGRAEAESCNIGSVNLDAFGTDILGATEAFRLMARFLYRATENPYGDTLAARIESRNRRIGVGFYGFQGWLAAHGVMFSQFPEWGEGQKYMDDFRLACRHAANGLADSLGAPRPVKVTAVAPTGTMSNLSGSTAGIHTVFAKWFKRRVRFSSSDPALKQYEMDGYFIEADRSAANTMIVEFPMQDSILDRFDADLIEAAHEVSFENFMKTCAAVQSSFCGGTDGNAISATAQIPAGYDLDRMVGEVAEALGTVKGMTVFPVSSRDQQPMEVLSEDEYLAIHDAVFERAGVQMFGDSNDGSCASGACPVR